MSNNLNPLQFGEYVAKDDSRLRGIAGGYDGKAATLSPGYNEALGHYTPDPKFWHAHAKHMGYGNPN